MKRLYSLAGRMFFMLDAPETESVANFIQSEYTDFEISYDMNKPLIGIVRAVENVISGIEIRELVKDCLYEDGLYLYVRYHNRYLRISVNESSFEIVYQYDFEDNVAFYVLELLLRLYAHKFDLDFFHASSFVYEDKVYMLNGFGGSGKTEIMLDYLLNGAGFISDDIVLINDSGQIFPYRVSIPVNWNCVNEKFVRQINVPLWIYSLSSYCNAKNGRITRRIFGRIAGKYLLGNFSFEQLTNAPVNLKFYNVDKCIWLQEANFAGEFSITSEEFFKYMNICLTNESRKYFDFDGFMLMKFPFLETFFNNIWKLRRQISSKLLIKGLAVKNRSFKKASERLLSI